MSDELKGRMVSDVNDEYDIGETCSLGNKSLSHLTKQTRRQPSIVLRMLDAALILTNRGDNDGLFNEILLGDMSEIDEVIKCNIATQDDFWHSIGYGLLEKAVKAGLINIVQMLLNHTDENIRMGLRMNRNLLYFACLNGQIELVEILLQRGFDPNLPGVGRDGYQDTCLNVASRENGIGMLEILLNYGADPNLHSFTLLHTDHHPPLTQACMRNNIEAVTMLLDNGADVNATNIRSRDNIHGPALYYATLRGYLDIARLLLDHGADANLTSSCGTTPLIVAIGNNHPQLTRLLLDHGADISIVNNQGRTAFDYVTPGSDIAQMIANAQAEYILK